MLHVGDLDHDALVLGGFVYGALHLEVSWLVHLEALELVFVGDLDETLEVDF